jgi:uncharacterized protein (DUF849 family)
MTKASVLKSPEERVRHAVELKPDICSLDMGSFNKGDRVFVNTPKHLQAIAIAIKDAGVFLNLKCSRPAVCYSPSARRK